MQVREAVGRRKSTRAFLPDPVPGDLVAQLLADAAKAPSGGNLQPWHVHALTGEPLRMLIAQLQTNGPDSQPGFAIYPDRLWDPYRSRRHQNAEDLYSSIGVARDDKPGRQRQLARNLDFFGAPVGIFVLIDRKMGPPQWADLGGYIQTLMLLAVEQGLATCPQAFWAFYSGQVERFLSVPEGQMVFCGIALGYGNPEAPINRLVTSRAPIEEWGSLHGFV